MDNILSVTELNRKVKSKLEKDSSLQSIFVEGEISNITYYRSGHLYFSLKDKKSQVKCAAFNYKFKGISNGLKEGSSVKVFGHVTVYEVTGQYQLLVDFIEERDKLGKLFLELEELKKEFKEKGYFDINQKKELPHIPKTIGVVTSSSGAAIHDIIRTSKKRFSNINIILFPSKVQGEGADIEIANGIEVLNKIDEVDVIIVGRGGGSIEDLWCFNKRSVGMAIYNSDKPIISAVGHETDFMLSDMVADVRAATPTQAIELLLPEKEELIETIALKEKALDISVKNSFKLIKNEIDYLENNYFLKNISKNLEQQIQFLLESENKLDLLFENYFKQQKGLLENLDSKNEQFNIEKIFSKGFAVVKNLEGKIINIDDVEIDDNIEVVMKKGKIEASVQKIQKKVI